MSHFPSAIHIHCSGRKFGNKYRLLYNGVCVICDIYIVCLSWHHDYYNIMDFATCRNSEGIRIYFHRTDIIYAINFSMANLANIKFRWALPSIHANNNVRWSIFLSSNEVCHPQRCISVHTTWNLGTMCTCTRYNSIFPHNRIIRGNSQLAVA